MYTVALHSLLVAAVMGATVADASPSATNETRSLERPPACFEPEYHFDFPGNDLTSESAVSFDLCCSKCFANTACGAYTWTTFNGGTCWLKSRKSSSAWAGANADGSAHTISVEVDRCGGLPLLKDKDVVGTDLGSTPSQRPGSCCHLCNFAWCRGFSWTDYNGGTCFFKGGYAIDTVPKEGVYSWFS